MRKILKLTPSTKSRMATSAVSMQNQRQLLDRFSTSATRRRAARRRECVTCTSSSRSSSSALCRSSSSLMVIAMLRVLRMCPDSPSSSSSWSAITCCCSCTMPRLSSSAVRSVSGAGPLPAPGFFSSWSLSAWCRLSMPVICSCRERSTPIRSRRRFRSLSVRLRHSPEASSSVSPCTRVAREPSLRRAAAVMREASEPPERNLVFRSWMLAMTSSASCFAS
mmetsp:Transcript_16221/g.41443  ORF Transcript_16221/g.41443 Transcript_16221/m.41443 type:complete len:222 (-) Transcript_16221:364-1029(-)